MKIVAFATQKGGVGKSMLTFNTAGILAKRGKKVCVIDTDPQGNVTNNLGVDRLSDPYNICNAFINRKPASDLIHTTNVKFISIIKGSHIMGEVELELNKMPEADRVMALKQYIQRNIMAFDQFDYILIDTNPSFSTINQNVLMASDAVILVTDVSMNSIEGAELLAGQWNPLRRKYGKEDNIQAVVINNYDKRTRLAKDFVEHLKKHEEFGGILLKTILPYSVKFKEAELEARPVFKGLHYMVYADLVKELTKRGVF